jgi:hypothetical protein
MSMFTPMGHSQDVLDLISSIMKETTEYDVFFKSALKKFNVNSPADLGDKKKEFYDYIDKNWNGEKEAGKDGKTESAEHRYGFNDTKTEAVNKIKLAKDETELKSVVLSFGGSKSEVVLSQDSKKKVHVYIDGVDIGTTFKDVKSAEKELKDLK